MLSPRLTPQSSKQQDGYGINGKKINVSLVVARERNGHEVRASATGMWAEKAPGRRVPKRN